MMGALLAGAMLAKLFLRYPPMELLQQSVYNLAKWTWRLVYHLLDCVPRPAEPVEAQWQDSSQEVPDQGPDAEHHRFDLLTRCSEYTSSPKEHGK